MKTCLILSCLSMLAAIVVAEKYTDKFDNVNVKEILSNERLYLAYCKCLLDQDKCTPEGNELKSHMEDALTTGCEKCTDKQKEGAEEVIRFTIEKYPDMWKKLCDKYDPDGKYRVKFEDEAKKRGITIPK